MLSRSSCGPVSRVMLGRGGNKKFAARALSANAAPQFRRVNDRVIQCQTSSTFPLLAQPSWRPSSSNRVGIRFYADYPDHIKMAMPALSPTMEAGSIMSWEKKIGDPVSEGDLLCEIETDKATMGFESSEEGYLASIILEAGAKDIPVGRLLCIIAHSAEDVEKFKDFKDDGKILGGSAAPPPPAPAAAAPPKASMSPPSIPAAPASISGPTAVPTMAPGDRPFASPAAKKLAQEKGIDLFTIAKGSGMGGMITTRDLEGVAASSTSGAGGLPAPGSFLGGMPTPMGEYSDAELSSMRKTIAKRLQASKLEIPHYYLTVECEMDEIMSLRASVNQDYSKEGVKLSVNDFIIKAVALASRQVPQCNSAWMDNAIREYHSCDVCVAVDTGSGLITPIVTNAGTKGLAEISENVKELAGRAKQGKLQPHEFQGGTITVSNLGMFGVEHFTAIINPPQACILAVGGTKPKVVSVKDGSNVVKNVMKVTLSCDHRVVDGAVGAQWLQYFKKFMEKPSSMLL